MDEQNQFQPETQPRPEPESKLQPDPQPQAYQNPMAYADTSPLSLGSYAGMLVLSLIPVVNLIMFLVWGFGSPNLNRRNFGRAALIILAVIVVLDIIFGAAMMSWIVSFAGTLPGVRA